MSSAVDIYDQKAKADWSEFGDAPDIFAQQMVQRDPGGETDVELGPTNNKAENHDALQPPAGTSSHPAEAATAVIKPTCSGDTSWRSDVIASVQQDAQQRRPVRSQDAAADPSSSSQTGFVEEEVRALQAATALSAIHIESRVRPQAVEGNFWLRRIFVNFLFGGLCAIACAPPHQTQQVGRSIEVCVLKCSSYIEYCL